MNLFDIPVSALRASQVGMAAVSGNLANATTPGYHRQVAHLSETVGSQIANIRVGAGVEVNHIQRMRSVWVERSLLRNISATGSAEVRNDVAHQLDTLFQVTDGSLTSRVEDFFNSWQDLSSQPAETTVRYDLLATASALTSEINDLHSRMSELSLDLDTQIKDTVASINQITANIARLNRDIAVTEASGKEANETCSYRSSRNTSTSVPTRRRGNLTRSPRPTARCSSPPTRRSWRWCSPTVSTG
jgi:flagellar hook-associated protein 1